MAKNDDKQIRGTLETLRERRAKLAGELTSLDQGIAALEQLLGETPTVPFHFESNGPNPPQRQNDSGVRRHSATIQWKDDAPTFPTGAFFGKSQSAAAVAVLRAVGKPLTMKQIVAALQSAQYPFETKNAYLSVYRALSEDRRPAEVQKHGILWGLRDMEAVTFEDMTKAAAEDIAELVIGEDSDEKE